MPVFPNRVPNLQAIGPIVDVIILPPQPVFSALKSANQPIPQQRVMALIDTGASGSCIEDSIAQQMGLIVRNVITVHTPAGAHLQNTYDLGLMLPALANFIFPVVACGSNLGNQPYKALIGRDILSQCTLVYNGWDNSYQLHI